MNTPHLIQRGSFNDVKGPITGIDQLVRFDYMGSSEFEFGALPASLKQMCREADAQEVYETGIKAHDGKGLFLVCVESKKEQALEFVKELASLKCKYHLKEATRLRDNLKGVNIFSGDPLGRYNTFNFWWDIGNQYMFCLGKDNAKNLVKAIRAVRDKKQREGVVGWY